MKYISWIPKHLLLFFKIYLFGILFFFVLRFLLLIATIDQLSTISDSKYWTLIQAFFMGWRFDTVISGYLLSLPLVLMSIAEFFKKSRKLFANTSKWIIIILYSIAFLICFTDIPFFQQFGNRMNMSAFQWFDSPKFVFKMIFGEIRYWIFIIPFFGFIWAWYYLIKRSFKKFSSRDSFFSEGFSASRIMVYLPITILFWGLLFLGIRGRIEKKSPIRIGTAFFSVYPYANQLGLNPVFTLLRSYLDQLKTENQPIDFMPDEQALSIVQAELKIDTIIKKNPIAREMNIGGIPQKHNVVLVIMESMGAQNMKRFGNTQNLTPTLDSLANNSISFDRAYTTGIHTCNGIFSSLYAFPAIPKKHPLNGFPIVEYSGLPGILKQNDYQTLFFLTHDDQFDNMGGFLKANHFNEIICERNYPQDKVLSTLGVPDHVMFEYAISILNQKHLKGNPFFAAFMTGSNHGPYIVPDDIPFKPKSSNIKTQIIEYADWAIADFINKAKKQEWFGNTIFVFIADHGYHTAGPYEMSLCYHHTPFIIYAPEIIDSAYSVKNIASQIDVFPTVLGLLQIPYVNNTLGVDLLNQSRKYAPISNDERMGCIGNDWLFVVREDKKRHLYDLNSKKSLNLYNQNIKEGDEMLNFTNSTYQTTQYLIKLKQTSIVL